MTGLPETIEEVKSTFLDRISNEHSGESLTDFFADLHMLKKVALAQNDLVAFKSGQSFLKKEKQARLMNYYCSKREIVNKARSKFEAGDYQIYLSSQNRQTL